MVGCSQYKPEQLHGLNISSGLEQSCASVEGHSGTCATSYPQGERQCDSLYLQKLQWILNDKYLETAFQ